MLQQAIFITFVECDLWMYYGQQWRTLIFLLFVCGDVYNLQAKSDGRDVAAVSKNDKPRVGSAASKISEVMSIMERTNSFLFCIFEVWNFVGKEVCEYITIIMYCIIYVYLCVSLGIAYRMKTLNYAFLEPLSCFP